MRASVPLHEHLSRGTTLCAEPFPSTLLREDDAKPFARPSPRKGKNLRGRDLRGASLEGCGFKDADLSGAKLDRAQATHTVLVAPAASRRASRPSATSSRLGPSSTSTSGRSFAGAAKPSLYRSKLTGTLPPGAPLAPQRRSFTARRYPSRHATSP